MIRKKVIGLAVVAAMGSAEEAHAKLPRHTGRHAVPLLSIGATTATSPVADPDDPGEGGGVDVVAWFTNVSLAAINNCTKDVEALVRAFATRNHLALLRRDPGKGYLALHYAVPELSGFLEFLYTMNPRSNRSRISVLFYDRTGRPTEPLALHKKAGFLGLGDLMTQLTEAIACERAAR